MMLLGTPHYTKWLWCLYKQPDPVPPQLKQTQKLKMKLACFFATTALASKPRHAEHGENKHTFQYDIAGTVYEAYYTDDQYSFWESKEHCDHMGGGWGLPTPTNSNENQAAFKLAEGRGNIYMGIAQQQVEDGDVSSTWFNLYTGEAIGYTNWRNRQPNNFRGSEDFAVMLK